VNAVSEELNKYQMFDVVLMTVAGHDGTTTKGTKLVRQRYNNNNNNNNNKHDNVYVAVIMTKVIARVHPVHLMNVD